MGQGAEIKICLTRRMSTGKALEALVDNLHISITIISDQRNRPFIHLGGAETARQKIWSGPEVYGEKTRVTKT